MINSPNYSSFTPTAPKKPLWKKIAFGLGIFVFILVVLISLAPTFLSTSAGLNYLAKWINKKNGGKLQIQSLSLSWFGAQEIEGLSYSDPSGSLFFSCERMRSDSSLFGILGSNHIGDTRIASPHLKMKKEFISYKKLSGPVTQQSSLVYIPTFTPAFQNNLFPFSGRLVVENGSIDFVASGLDPVSIHDINTTVFLAEDKSRISLSLDAISSEEKASGKIYIDGSVLNMSSVNPKISLESHISSLPIKALDQLLTLVDPSYKGLLIDTFGSTFSLSLNGKLSRNDLQLHMSASSPNFTANFATISNESTITLKEPAKITFAASRSLLERFLPQVQTLTNDPLSTEITLSDLKIPVSDAGISLQGMSIQAQAQLSSINLANGKYTLGPALLTFNSASLQTGSTFSLKAPIIQQQKTAEISVSGTMAGLFSNALSASAECNLKEVPSALIDSLANSTYASAILGSAINANIKTSIAPSISHIYFSIQTPTLTINNAHWTVDDTIRLQEPFTSTLAPSDALYALLFPGNEVIAAPSHPLQFNIEGCNLPSLGQLEKLYMKATLQTSLLSYEKAFAFSPYVIENLSSDILISSYDNISIDLESSLFAFTMEGSYKPKDNFFLSKKPIKISYLLTDDQIQSLAKSQERPYLVNPALIHAEIEPTTIAFGSDLLTTLMLKAFATVDNFALQNKEASKQAAIEQTKLLVDYNGKSAICNVDFSSQLSRSPEVTSEIDAHLKASSFLHQGSIDTSKLALTGDLSLQNIPTSLVQMLSAESIPLGQLLGPSFDMKAQIDSGANAQEISVQAKSQYLDADAHLSIKEGILSLKQAPGHIDFTLTPQSYLIIDKLITEDDIPPPYTLGEKTTFTFTINELFVPYKITPCKANSQESCLMIGLRDVKISGDLSNVTLSFSDAKNQSIVLKDTHLSFQKQQGDSPIQLQLNASATGGKASGQSGSLQMSTEISNIFAPSGDIDFSHVFSKANMNIQKLPTSVLDLFARTFGDESSTFSSIFGPSLTATLSLSLQDATGPVLLNVNSPGSRVSLSGKLTNGILTLNEPVYAQVTMTPELSKFLLHGVNPLSITEIKSNNPITLEIQPAGFSVPITPFSMDKVNIPSARIELGQISCKNEGNLNIALSLLKSVQLSQNHTLQLWFTPIDLHINKGVVDMERTDILVAETFDIALWGTINPVRNNVDMVLGLTSECLGKAFGIKNLPQDYVLQVPMTGTMDNVQINTTKATAKVAALLAWQQAAIAGGAAAGPAGALFGHFLNKLGSLPLNDKDTPPPKKPFPWDKEASFENETKKKDTAQKSKKAHIKKSDKPLKQILKIIK